MDGLLGQDKTLMALGCAFYALAFVPVLVALIRRREYPHCLFLLFLVCGFGFQSVGLYLRGAANHDFPVQNTFEVFQVVAWCAIAVNFIVRQLFSLRLLNFFASGLALLCSAVSFAMPGWDQRVANKIGGNPWVDFHAGLAIASYAVFAALALTSVMYLIQDRALAKRQSGNFSHSLPAIGQLEAVNTRLIALGVSLLSVSMMIGVLNMWENPASVRGIKLAIACTVWISYLIILVLRRRKHLIGRPFARACVTVFLYALCLLWPLTYQPPSSETAPEPANAQDEPALHPSPHAATTLPDAQHDLTQQATADGQNTATVSHAISHTVPTQLSPTAVATLPTDTAAAGISLFTHSSPVFVNGS